MLAAITLVALMSNVEVHGQELKGTPEQVKAAEAWTATLAVQAVTYADPLVAMYNLRSTVAVGPRPKAPPNDSWRCPLMGVDRKPTAEGQTGAIDPQRTFGRHLRVQEIPRRKTTSGSPIS
jgi:hypothetical protein